MTHNTRKEIEVRLAYLKDFPVSPDPECNHSVYDEIIVAFNQLEQSFHHQLQKGQEEEKMGILKIALTMGDCPINNPKADAGWMKFQHDFCLKLTKDNKKSILSGTNHSELDQDEQ